MPTAGAEAKFCPRCASPLVTFSMLGGDASCGRCKWSGDASALLTTSFEHDLGSNEEVLRVFAVEFRNTLAKSAGRDLGLLLVKWGFLSSNDPEKQRHQLSRLLAAMARGAIKELLEERTTLAREMQGGSA